MKGLGDSPDFSFASEPKGIRKSARQKSGRRTTPSTAVFFPKNKKRDFYFHP